MLTTKAIHVLGKALNFGSRIGFQAMNFNFVTNKFYVGESTFFGILVKVNLIHQIMYSGFMVTRLIVEATDKGTTNYSQLFWLLLYSDGGCWFTGTSVWAWIHRFELAKFLNEIVTTTLSFAKEREKLTSASNNVSKIDWMRVIMIYYNIVWAEVAVIIVFGVFTINPGHKHFVYSAVYSEGFKLPEILYFYAFEIYSKSSMMYAVNVVKIAGFTLYIGTTSWALNQIWESNNSIGFQIMSYKKFQLLSKLQGNLFAAIMPLWYSAWGIMWILGVVGALKLREVVPIFDYITIVAVIICGGSCLIGITHFCGNIPYRCRLLVTRKWKKVVHNKFWRKKILSLQMFGVKNGPVKVLRHNAIYILFGFFINMIVTILVANPEMGHTK